jgi:hypothetical protein
MVDLIHSQEPIVTSKWKYYHKYEPNFFQHDLSHPRNGGDSGILKASHLLVWSLNVIRNDLDDPANPIMRNAPAPSSTRAIQPFASSNGRQDE